MIHTSDGTPMSIKTSYELRDKNCNIGKSKKVKTKLKTNEIKLKKRRTTGANGFSWRFRDTETHSTVANVM